VITSVREIVSHNPSREIWKYLRLFLNPDATVEKLRQLHKVPTNKHEGNLKKQARQLSYCLRQAEEYFHASERVDLATQPLLLYYGCVSLSQSLVLLKKDGTFSLDASRKFGKHNHHGLELERGLAEMAAKGETLERFFSTIQCACHKNAQGEPTGHFPVVYSCLEPPAFIVHSELHDAGRPSYIERDDAVNCADLQPLDRIGNQRFSCWELLKSLPDLYNTLLDAGVRPSLAPGAMMRRVVNHYAPVPSNAVNDSTSGASSAGNRPLDKTVDSHHFFINRLSVEQKTTLSGLCQRNPHMRVLDEYPSNLHIVLELETKAGTQVETGYYPDVVDDLHGQKYYLLQPDSYLPEPASMLVITYCLGMLSRYFPDVWMRVTDSRIEIAEVTNTLLTVVQRKFPNLILDQMTGVKHYIHS
jgi:YaaC-like Protein